MKEHPRSCCKNTCTLGRPFIQAGYSLMCYIVIMGLMQVHHYFPAIKNLPYIKGYTFTDMGLQKARESTLAQDKVRPDAAK